MGLTYVTAFLELPGSRVDPQVFIEKFLLVAQSGVPIILYISQRYYEIAAPFLVELPNVRIGAVIELAHTWTWSIVTSYSDLQLPSRRSPEKDTLEYMICQHAKMEFMWAASRTGQPTDVYAWMDFRIAHVFQDVPQSLAELAYHVTAEYVPNLCLFPGCWPAGHSTITEGICWRFCGGFFVLSHNMIDSLWAIIKTALPQFLEKERVMVWEVNFWAYLETTHGWAPQWYSADHNDTLVRLPVNIYKSCQLANLDQYDYQQQHPIVPSGYYPMNTSYVDYRGLRLLNVRCVNYRLTTSGSYIIDDIGGIIRTKNVMCILDDTYSIFTSNEIATDISLPSSESAIQGLEDIRLFTWKGRPHYIATQRMWSPCGRNRMMLGPYEPSIRAGTLLHPPTETGCEKNWIPCVDPATDELRIIYSWNPYSVGVIDADGKLRITAQRHLCGLGRHLKGSTVPVHYKDGLLCVAHYSVESAPRIYMHLLVRLDARTLMPTHWTAPFSFRRVGIEYCIGFHVDGASDMAHFWISEHDKEPGLVRAPLKAFKFMPI